MFSFLYTHKVLIICDKCACVYVCVCVGVFVCTGVRLIATTRDYVYIYALYIYMQYMVFVVINIHIDSLLLHPLGQGEIFNTYSGRFQAQFGQCRAPSTGSYDQSLGFLKEKEEFKLVEGFL